MKKLLSVALFILLISRAFSQTITVKGIVTDKKDKSPLPGVYIYTPDTKYSATTDMYGKYSVQLPKKEVTLIVKFIGYKDVTKTIDLSKIKTNEYTLNFELEQDNVMLQTFVVSGSRFEQKLEETTVSVDVIKPDLIDNRNTYNIDNVVKQVPGVDVQDGQANIRGGSGFSYGAGSRVMVLLDDLPLISADAGDVKWNYLPVENVEQLEIIKGASSVLYGSASLNGVINLMTKEPTNTPETKINVFHGFYWDPVRADSLGNRRDSTGKLRKPLKWWKEQDNPVITGMDFYHGQLVKKFAYTISGNLFSNEGYRQGEFEKRARAFTKMKYYFNDKKNHSAGVNSAIMYQNAAFFLLWQDADSGAYIPRGGIDTPATSLTYTHGIRFNIDPYWKYAPNENTQHNVKTRFYRTTNVNLVGNQSSNGNVWFAEYRYMKKINTWKLTGGLAYSYSNVKSNLYDDHDAENRAIYMQANKEWDRLKIVFGIRGEYYRIDSSKTKTDWIIPKGIKFNSTSTTWKDTLYLAKGMNVKPVIRLGANYRIHKATFLRASFGQGYRFPSIAERYVRTSLSGLNVFPNPDLQPETGWSTEFGVKQGFEWKNLKGFIDFTAFWMEYSNMIEFQFGTYYPDSITSPTITDLFNYSGFKSVNVGNARISGYEVGINFMYNYKEIEVMGFAGYTYMNPINLNYDSAYRATFSDTTTNMLKYRFKHMFRSDMQINYKKFGFGFSSRYNSFMQNIDRAFEDPLFGNIEATKLLPGLKEYRQMHNKGYWIFDARLQFKPNENNMISLVVENVFNTEYMGRPADIRPPRTTMLRYSVKF